MSSLILTNNFFLLWFLLFGTYLYSNLLFGTYTYYLSITDNWALTYYLPLTYYLSHDILVIIICTSLFGTYFIPPKHLPTF